jgi:hypothetical protein
MDRVRTQALVPTAAADPARALFCSPPPDEGDLENNGTGWLVARGSLEQRLIDPPSEVRVIASAAVGALLATSLTAMFHKVLAVAVAIVPFVAFDHLRRIRVRRKLARLESLALTPGYRDVPSGSAVRVQGTVGAQATFPSLFQGTPCVLARSARAGADELRGIDFTLDLDDGQRIRVAVRDGHLHDRPPPIEGPPLCGPVYASFLSGAERIPRLTSGLLQQVPFVQRAMALHEVTVGPGDRVEVTGFVHHEVAPDGLAAPGRQTPMRHVLRSAPGMPLTVRRLPPPTSEPPVPTPGPPVPSPRSRGEG